jgi:glycerophosphoryl diester phosphodiesterase
VVDIYAHRGLHLNEQENSLGAFSAAVALGVDGVELDVRRTVDGVLVIHHDPMIRALAISRTRYQDLKDDVATFEEAMDVLRGVRVNVEIKNSKEPTEATYDASGDLARQVVSSLQRSNWANECIISSFDLATCMSAHDYDPDMRVGWLFWDIEPLEAIGKVREAGLQAIHPHFAVVTSAVVDLARANDLDVNVWTVNNADDMAAMAALGVTSIITDLPALAIQLLG